jgi:signal peptidase I
MASLSPDSSNASTGWNVRKLLLSLLVIAGVMLSIRWSLLAPYFVTTASMEPTLFSGDLLLVHKASYRFWLPFLHVQVGEQTPIERGDIVVFRYPNDLLSEYVKSVIGVAGDRLQVRRHTVILNGVELSQETLLPLPGGRAYRGESFGGPWTHLLQYSLLGESEEGIGMWSPDVEYVVPPESVFVMGDHRDASTDSREWGHVPVSYVRGKVISLLWKRTRPTSLKFFGTINEGHFFQKIDPERGNAHP